MIDTIQYPRQVNNKGYVKINLEGKWVYEHLFVVEQFIKRELEEGEVVHHIDSNRQNNDISNLMIFKSQEEHKRFENQVKQFGWTRPLLDKVKNRWNDDRSK